MLETLAIRSARVDELPTCASFWMAMFEEVGNFREAEFAPDWRARFVTYFSRRIAEGDAAYFVACDDQRIVGTAGAQLADGFPAAVHGLRFGYIFGVRVEPRYRGNGLATALTRAAVNFLRDRKCRRIRLHASPFGRPIYEKLGFVATNEMQYAP